MNVSVKDVERACAAELKKAGYKTVGTVAYHPLTDTVYAWVGLNIIKHPTFVRINANIGVHCVPVMRCLDEIRGRKYQTGRIATFADPIGVMVPDEQEIVVTDSAEIDNEVKRLMSYINGPGREYVQRFTDLTVLAKALYQRVGELGGNPEKYALLLLLEKKEQAFRDFSNEQLARFGSAGEHDATEEWKDFEEKAESCIQKTLSTK